MSRHVIAGVLALALAVSAAPGPARAAYMLPGTPLRPKDFALVKSDGYYHLFYILNSAAQFPDQTENSFGHAISSDLYHWTQLPPVLKVSALGWDNLHVWAPSIVQKDGLWWMIYTGVTLDGTYNRTQRIGLAVSPDLSTWTRVDAPVWDATQVPWAWSAPASAAPAFRDPYVMPDPQNPGGWLMYYTASYAPDPDALVVGVARSAGDLHSWTDVGPLLITWRGLTFNQITESPHMIYHGGLWYLFITTESSQAITVFTSPDPTGPTASWTQRGRLRQIIGLDTSAWYASEGLVDGTHQLFAFVNGDRIELRELVFGSSWTFSMLQPPFFHVMSVESSTLAPYEGDAGTLLIRTANPASGNLGLSAYLVDAQGAETAVPAESLGLALPTTAATDTLTVPWVARRWPRVPLSDETTVTRFHVRTADSTAVSAVITVRAHSTALLADDPPGLDPVPPFLRPLRNSLRVLHDTPLGATAALAVSLDSPGSARVDLYDVLGRRVRNLAERDLPAGVTVLAWDGRDASGARLQHGVYFARLVTGGRSLTTRVLLLGE